MLKISFIFLAFIAFFVLTLKVTIVQMGRLTDKYERLRKLLIREKYLRSGWAN